METPAQRWKGEVQYRVFCLAGVVQEIDRPSNISQTAGAGHDQAHYDLD